METNGNHEICDQAKRNQQSKARLPKADRKPTAAENFTTGITRCKAGEHLTRSSPCLMKLKGMAHAMESANKNAASAIAGQAGDAFML